MTDTQPPVCPWCVDPPLDLGYVGPVALCNEHRIDGSRKSFMERAVEGEFGENAVHLSGAFDAFYRRACDEFGAEPDHMDEGHPILLRLGMSMRELGLVFDATRAWPDGEKPRGRACEALPYFVERRRQERDLRSISRCADALLAHEAGPALANALAENASLKEAMKASDRVRSDLEAEASAERDLRFGKLFGMLKDRIAALENENARLIAAIGEERRSFQFIAASLNEKAATLRAALLDLCGDGCPACGRDTGGGKGLNEGEPHKLDCPPAAVMGWRTA